MIGDETVGLFTVSCKLEGLIFRKSDKLDLTLKCMIEICTCR